jgi:hypothetical protein
MKKELTEKQINTQNKMREVRYDDYINLRDLIEKRLSWIKEEKQKAVTSIKELEIQLARLEGAEIVLLELLNKK